MAPHQARVAITALSTHVTAHDEKTILVEAGSFTPMRWFLEHGSQSTVHDLGEPPQKRQRLSSGDDPKLDLSSHKMSEQESHDAQLIPLLDITVDIHFPRSLSDRGAEQLLDDSQFSEHQTVPVLPYRIDVKGPEGESNGDDRVDIEQYESRICFMLPEAQSPILSVECSSLPKSIVGMLQAMGLPDRFKRSRSSKHIMTPASSLSCTLTRSTEPSTVVRLHAALSWQSGVSAFPGGIPSGRGDLQLDRKTLLHVFDEHAQYDSKRLTPQDFYESIQAPMHDACEDDLQLYQNILQSDLFPFQKRAVTWLLKREGVKWEDGRVQDLSPDEQLEQCLSLYETRKDLFNRDCSVNLLQGIVSREVQIDRPIRVSGGLLAEEMGLGKTVELLSLITLHRREIPLQLHQMHDDSDTQLSPSMATLIITPTSILDQWKSELRRHAPDLLVYHYEGVASSNKASSSENAMLNDLAVKYDVVLTTYQVLAREVHFATDPPERNMRHSRKYERKRSPLIQLQWWRICLDEAQMIESGVTNAARVACRLPRVHSWAVSGTPLRKNTEDLRGLLIFLRYTPFDKDSKLWSHLILHHRHLLRRIFGQIALRHTKAQVREELRLPQQKRVVVTVPFSMVEQQNYSALFENMCDEIALNLDGSPKSELWDPNDSSTVESMRSWLIRLRQTCLHPQVGVRNRRALGRGQKPLRTVAEVLEVMIEQNEVNLRTEERAVLMSSLLRAHILGNNGEDTHRSERALEIYESAMEKSNEILTDARERLSAAKAAQVEEGATAIETDEEDSSTESSPILGRLRNNLRTALQLRHVCIFFTATACYQIKTNESLTPPDSDKFSELEQRETELYDSAKLLRREILVDPSRKAEMWIRKIETLQKTDALTEMPTIKNLKQLGGIESRRIAQTSQGLFDVIRKEIDIIKTWRSKIVEFLLKPLVDEDEGIETTGDEYEDSTKQQDELYVYFDAFKAVHADLNTLITGEAAPLTDHEVKIALRDAQWVLNPEIDEENKPFVHAPELAVKLLTQRNEQRKLQDTVGSVRGLIQETRALEGAMHGHDPTSRAGVEWSIMKQHLADLQGVFTSYSKALIGLEKEVDLFRAAQNQRVEFYRQLQELSDAVAPYREELDDKVDLKALQATMQKEEQQAKLLAQLRTKHRFLTHLRDETGAQAGSRICVICQCSFERGVLTVCGHQFCKECIQHWFQQSKTCPVCKRGLHLVDMHEITYNPREIRAQEEDQTGESSVPHTQHSDVTPSGETSLYSDVDSKVMDEIKSIDLPASYGTKIDTLGRHLHWIREHDPGAKSIVFSQFRDFLDVLSTALSDFRINYSRLGRAGAADKFRNDPTIDCLLLDAKADASGLTLVNATHVFICEPLIQTAVELQAIARVHRIGQTRPTTVWMYLINDTVEEAIYEISVKRRLAHMRSRNEQIHRNSKAASRNDAAAAALQEVAIDAANSEEMQSAPLTKLLAAGKGSGEMVGNDDLWQCLFGKAQNATPKVNGVVEREIGRHFRAEAAEQRRADAM